MNRNQRRTFLKDKTMTQQDLKNLIVRENRRVLKQTVADYSVAVAIILKDKLGFGKIRVERTLTHIKDIFDSMHRGDVSVEDIKNTLKEELGIEIS